MYEDDVSLYTTRDREDKNGMNMMLFAEAMQPKSSNMAHMKAILTGFDSDSN